MLAHFAVESVRDFFRVTFPIQKTSDRLRDDRVHLEAAVTGVPRGGVGIDTARRGYPRLLARKPRSVEAIRSWRSS